METKDLFQKTYTNRSFPGTVNVSDPIISSGLSESILKKQTDKQMLLFKGRAIAANKNCKKILMVSNVCISLCLACKTPRGILRGCPRKNGQHNFSTFTDFLIIVQFWFFWFYPRALSGLSMTQCTRTFLGITCCMDCSFFKKRIQPIETAFIRFKVEPVALWYRQQ